MTSGEWHDWVKADDVSPLQVAANASTLNADLTKGFILGGSSSGANFAAVIGNLVRDEGTTPRLTALYLSVPAVLSPPAVPEELKREYLSHEQNKDAPFLSAKVVEIFNGNTTFPYQGDRAMTQTDLESRCIQPRHSFATVYAISAPGRP